MHARTTALVFVLASALAGCEVVEQDDDGTGSSADPSTGGGSGAPSPPRTVSPLCNASPTLLQGSAHVNGAFCFGVAHSASAALRCGGQGVVECIDELAGFAYVVRWTGSVGTVTDASGTRALGTVRVNGVSSYEIATPPTASAAALGIGVCTLGVVNNTPVASYCPYTN